MRSPILKFSSRFLSKCIRLTFIVYSTSNGGNLSVMGMCVWSDVCTIVSVIEFSGGYRFKILPDLYGVENT